APRVSVCSRGAPHFARICAEIQWGRSRNLPTGRRIAFHSPELLHLRSAPSVALELNFLEIQNRMVLRNPVTMVYTPLLRDKERFDAKLRAAARRAPGLSLLRLHDGRVRYYSSLRRAHRSAESLHDQRLYLR